MEGVTCTEDLDVVLDLDAEMDARLREEETERLALLEVTRAARLHEGSALLTRMTDEPLTSVFDLNGGPSYSRRSSDLRPPPLRHAFYQSVLKPLSLQSALVNAAVVQYFMVELQLVEHLSALRRLVLLHRGEFAQALVETIAGTPHHAITASAHQSQDRTKAEVPLGKTGIPPMRLLRSTLAAVRLDLDAFTEHLRLHVRKGAADEWSLGYSVSWPLNIVLDEETLKDYSMVSALLLRVRFVARELAAVWLPLRRTVAIDSYAAKMLRQVCGIHHEMHHFVTVLGGYLSDEVLVTCWDTLQRELAAPLLGLDDLRAIHTRYINGIKTKAFVSKAAKAILTMIHAIFAHISMFCHQANASIALLCASSGPALDAAVQAIVSGQTKFRGLTALLASVAENIAKQDSSSHLNNLLLRLYFNPHYDVREEKWSL